MDCGVDISGRGGKATRCKDHAADWKRKSNAKWIAANPEKQLGAERKYRSANREKRREQHRKYRDANPEKLLKYERKWRAANPEKARESVHRYQASKRAQLGVVSKGISLRLLTAQEYRCAACGTDIRSPQTYHLDHIFPLSRGGLHDDSNLQCLCPFCNVSKGAKLPAEWAAACAAKEARLSA